MIQIDRPYRSLYLQGPDRVNMMWIHYAKALSLQELADVHASR